MRLRLLLALIWLGVMIALASMPSPDDPSSGVIANVVHAVQFVVFVVILLSFSRAVLPRFAVKALLALVGMVALLVGVGQEWYQSFLPYREADAGDVLFDAVGIAVGLLLWTLAAFFRKRFLQRPLVTG